MATIAIATRTGMQQTEAFYPTRGLAVTRMLDHRTLWHVTHLASGMSLDTGFRQRQRAKHYQDALLHTDIDWTQDAQTLLALPYFQSRIHALHGSCAH